MFVESLQTYQFRNLKDLKIALAPGMICIVGQNGQGKTNIVEAISLISFGRSFRTNEVKDLVKFGVSEASVFASVVSEVNANADGLSGGLAAGSASERHLLGIVISEGRRRGLLDGNDCKSVAELFPLLRCVTFSPTDLSLITGGPGERRRFLDRHTVDLNANLVWSFIDYQRALKSKQAILRNSNKSPINADDLVPWNTLLSESGAKIINARFQMLAKMEPILARYSNTLFEDAEAITLKTRGPSTQLLNERAGAHVTPADLLAQFSAAAEREISLQRTAVGPHRDDVIPYMFGHDARSFASQGQSRSIVLVLKLAMVELIKTVCGESPVVLLDDVDSELDIKRRSAIFSSMAAQSGQLIITCTEKRMPAEVESQIAQTLHVAGGELISDLAN